MQKKNYSQRLSNRNIEYYLEKIYIYEIHKIKNNKLFTVYNYEDDCGKTKYLHNLKTVQNEEIKKNEEFQKILNKTFRELYEEYINSDEFKIDEINRLKKKNGDEYIKKYKELAENLIEFFSD